jgi:endoglucanase
MIFHFRRIAAMRAIFIGTGFLLLVVCGPRMSNLFRNSSGIWRRAAECRERRLRRSMAVVLLFVLVAWTGTARAAPDFIHADGTQLLDGKGAPFAVKGINLGNWLVPEGYMFKFARKRAPSEIAEVIEALAGPQEAARFWTTFRENYVAQADIEFIKRAGFNTVRVPLHWRLFMTPGAADDGSADTFNGEGWALLDRLVGWCREAGLRVIVDLHAAPGGQTGVNHDDGVGFPLTFYVPRYRAQTVALWKAIAAHYRDQPTVLGYDLLNEPISPYSDEAYLNPRLEPLYREIVAAIRSVDAHHVVLLAGGQWSTSFAMFDRPFDANAVYTYHKFWAAPSRDSLQSYLNFSKRWNVPILIGETGEMNDRWNARFRALHDQFGIGWVFWPFKSLDSRTSVVSIVKPAGWDLVAQVGSHDTIDPATLPPRAEALKILDAYLEAIKFQNVRINAGYLESLGLAAR